MPDPSQAYGGDLSGTQTRYNYNGSGARPASSSDSASSRSSNGANFSYSPSSRSSNGANFSYSPSGISSSYGQSHTTTAPINYGPTVPSSFGAGRSSQGAVVTPASQREPTSYATKTGAGLGGAITAGLTASDPPPPTGIPQPTFSRAPISYGPPIPSGYDFAHPGNVTVASVPQIPQAITPIPPPQAPVPSTVLAQQYGLYRSAPGDIEYNKGYSANHAAMQAIKGYEGAAGGVFSPKPYRDNDNRPRLGFGSDTMTAPDGTVTPVTWNSTTDAASAERDLARRVNLMQQNVIKNVGQSAWDKLPLNTQSALTSVAYNYTGLNRLPSLVKAAQSGDPSKVAQAIANRAGDNQGINARRRSSEAQLALRGGAPGATGPQVIASLPQATDSPLGITGLYGTKAPKATDAMPPELRAPSGSYASIDGAVPLRDPSGSYAAINMARILRDASGSFASVDGFTPPLRGPASSYAALDAYNQRRAPSGSYASIDGAKVLRAPSGSYASIDGQTPPIQKYTTSVSGGFGMPGYGQGVTTGAQVARMVNDPKWQGDSDSIVQIAASKDPGGLVSASPTLTKLAQKSPKYLDRLMKDASTGNNSSRTSATNTLVALLTNDQSYGNMNSKTPMDMLAILRALSQGQDPYKGGMTAYA